MEEIIKQILNTTHGDGSGDGYGDGYGSGDGYGYGYGDGYGYGYGDGYGYGYGDGDGYGDGSGSGDGLNTFNEDKVYLIDSIPTIIKAIKGNIAKGFILNNDLTLEETFVVKGNNQFAHGRTLHEAFQSLQEKLYDSSTEEERIQAFKEHFKDFNKRYPAKELFTWHHVLTGSCKQGRESFCKSNGIDIEKDQFSIHEFINLTKFAYGGETIRKLV